MIRIIGRALDGSQDKTVTGIELKVLLDTNKVIGVSMTNLFGEAETMYYFK